MVVETPKPTTGNLCRDAFNPPLAGMVVETSALPNPVVSQSRIFQPTPSRDGC
ncbi:MAG: hypothetical protein RMY35_033445 [Nostoc sp. DedSLP01]